MTKEEIVEMARPFLWGGNVVEGWTFNSYEQLECFARLVAEHEREMCAKEAERTFYSVQAAENIRARGNHD